MDKMQEMLLDCARRITKELTETIEPDKIPNLSYAMGSIADSYTELVKLEKAPDADQQTAALTQLLKLLAEA